MNLAAARRYMENMGRDPIEIEDTLDALAEEWREDLRDRELIERVEAQEKEKQ
jgi:hypothetical protein